MLAIGVGAGTGCADKAGGTALGVLAGAAAGAAIGAAAGGSDGAIIGAVGGAVVGGVVGYALSGKKEVQKKPEAQVREELKTNPAATTTVEAPLSANIVEVRTVAVSPTTVAAGQKANLQIGMLAVGDGKSVMYPPAADVSMYRGDQLLYSGPVTTESTGDVDVSVDLEIPEEAEPGTYRVVVAAKPDARVPNPQPVGSSRESTFEVVQTTAWKQKRAGTAVAVAPKP